MGRSLISLLVVAFVSFSRLAIAQGTGATISGRITDTSGAVITRAEVHATNILTGSKTETTTNGSGIYVLPNLNPGEYRVTVDKEGFREIVLTGLTLNLQDSLSRNFTMQVGSVIQSMTLTADGPKVDLSPSVSTVVNEQFVQNMPLNGRSFQSLMALTPGFEFYRTSYGAGGAAPGQFVVNGERPNGNYFTIDGVSANFGSTIVVVDQGQALGGAIPAFTISGGTNGLLSVDAMQEFRIQTSSFAAEYGRTPGAQISIVTKSGTSQFHGTAYDYLRNDFFDARNYFDAPPLPQPPLRQNDFGGTLGGPIPRANTFFFFSYEGLRLRLPQTSTADIYTLAARRAVAPAFQPILNALPIPDGRVNPDGITAPLTAAYSDPTSLNAYSLRVDHSIGQRIKLFGRYSYAPSTERSRGFSFSGIDVTATSSESVTAAMTVSISPTKMNDFRANWSRASDSHYNYIDSFDGAIPPPDSALYPPGYNSKTARFTFSADDSNGFAIGQSGSLIQRQWNLVDTFSISSETHQLKFGFDFRRLTPTEAPESYSDLVFGSYPQLQDGIASDIIPFADSTISVAMNNFSLFAQDTWRTSPRLALSYGLRWEINTPPVSTTRGSPLYAVNGIFNSQPFGLAPAGTPLWHTGYTNFAPRIGAAYQLSASTMLRGGFGLFYDLGYGGGVSGTMTWFPYQRPGAGAGPVPFNLTSPAFQPPPFTLVPTAVTAYVNAIDPKLRLPVTYQWNVAGEHAFGANQSLSATYVGSFGDRLLREDVVVIPPGTPWVFSTHNAGWSHYNALQLQYQRRMSRGLQALVSYTFGKSMDTESSDVCQCQYVPQLSFVNADYDYAPSNFDVRHTFSAALSYQVPNTDWGGSVGRAILRGWAADGIVRWNSAQPFTIYAKTSSAGPFLDYVRPNIVPGVPFYIPYNQPGGRILNIKAFSTPTDTPGDLPRNYFRGFPISQTDLAVSRRFGIGERLNLYFRAECFNVFNHPMFGPPLFPFLTNSSFGRITETLNQYLDGQNLLYSIGGPRSGQLTLKFQF